MCGGGPRRNKLSSCGRIRLQKLCAAVFSWIPVDTFYAKPINPMNNIKSLPPFKTVQSGIWTDNRALHETVFQFIEGQTMFEL